MDYPRDFVTPVMAWYSYDLTRLEHMWARALLRVPGMTPINGFGCSDCRCQAHLFHSATKPSSTRVLGAIGGRVETLQLRPA
jgi:Uri superfamily endonuclease